MARLIDHSFSLADRGFGNGAGINDGDIRALFDRHETDANQPAA